MFYLPVFIRVWEKHPLLPYSPPLASHIPGHLYELSPISFTRAKDSVSPLASLSRANPYITVRQGLSLGLVGLIIGLNYSLPWNSIRHPRSCHGLMVGRVLVMWVALDNGVLADKTQQRLEMCLCDGTCSLVCVVIAVTETCSGSPVGAKRVRGMWSRPAPGLQLGAEHDQLDPSWCTNHWRRNMRLLLYKTVLAWFVAEHDGSND